MGELGDSLVTKALVCALAYPTRLILIGRRRIIFSSLNKLLVLSPMMCVP
jgi:hypothetical protein